MPVGFYERAVLTIYMDSTKFKTVIQLAYLNAIVFSENLGLCYSTTAFQTFDCSSSVGQNMNFPGSEKETKFILDKV